MDPRVDAVTSIAVDAEPKSALIGNQSGAKSIAPHEAADATIGYADERLPVINAVRHPGDAPMSRATFRTILGLMAGLFLGIAFAGAEEPVFDRKEDVIYGRKFGTALTMDVFTPKKDALGIGVILVVSGGFVSSHDAIQPAFIRPLTDRGYTVFAVVHGSQPRYTVLEIVQDMNRAVRFIRHHSKDYGIDPARIGVCGASAGGHLSLMLGTAGDVGKPDAKDPVDRESSRVQAVACFFPPTDFLNYGAAGNKKIHAIDHGPPYRAAFDYRELDPNSRLWVSITDSARLEEIARQVSPVYHVTSDDPPTFIIHGDKDQLVPLQQSELIVEKLKKAGVETELVVKPGAGHGWLTIGNDIAKCIDWFDHHLRAPEKNPPKGESSSGAGKAASAN
jgi:acetyl esterase/lipase